jgi:hypothetical protein
MIYQLTMSTAGAQSSVGLKLGMGWSMPRVTYSSGSPYGSSSSSSGRNGIVAGIISQLPLGAGWWMKPSAQFTWKGFYEAFTTYPGYGVRAGNTMNYLEVPLNVVYTSGVKGSGFQAGGGPVFSHLLNSNFRDYALKRTDIGINLLTGYQLPIGFSFNLSYTHGLGDVVKNRTNYSSLKNRFLALTVSYLF